MIEQQVGQRILMPDGMSARVIMPRGAAAGWTPAQPTTDGGVSAHTWLYAGTIIGADGDAIGSWTSAGSDAFSVVQAAAGAKPTLKLNIINGLPVLRFDGGDNLRGAFVGAAIAQPLTVFAVAQLDATVVNNNAFNYIFDNNVPAGNRLIIGKRGDTVPDAWTIYAGVAFVGVGAADANWNVWTALFSGALSQAWLNGVAELAGNPGALGLAGLTVGASANAIATNFWKGDIAEILIYVANLSTADKNQVGQYLATKYGLAYAPIP